MSRKINVLLWILNLNFRTEQELVFNKYNNLENINRVQVYANAKQAERENKD